MTTLTAINSLAEVRISEYTQLEWAVIVTGERYARAAEIAREAWAAFDDAIEAGSARRNELAEYAELADANQNAAYHDWQNAKAQLLAECN